MKKGPHIFSCLSVFCKSLPQRVSVNFSVVFVCERLSTFTEFYLKPLVHNLPSLLKDTTDLINKIQTKNAEYRDVFDIWIHNSLYPTIKFELVYSGHTLKENPFVRLDIFLQEFGSLNVKGLIKLFVY